MKAGRAAACEAAGPPSDGLKLIVFDFDQTLSVIHVFKTLAGWSRERFQVPQPHACTERGQVRRIMELSQIEPFRSERGGFASVAFGGEARVEQIRDLLERLQARDVNLVICTKGLVGAVRKCLSDLNLLNFFSQVYGNVGDNYGETSFDKELMRSRPSSKELQFISSPENAAWRSKDKLVHQLAHRAGLSRDQAMLVEDDAEEIRRAAPVCRTLWVKEAAGITSRHIAALLQLVEGGRQPASGVEDFHLPRAVDPRLPPRLEGRFEARQCEVASRGSDATSRDFNNSRGSKGSEANNRSHRRLEEGPTSLGTSEGNSRMEGMSRIELELEIARLSLEDDCCAAQAQSRRNKTCADSGTKGSRRSARPVSRGSHSRTLQAAGSRMFTGAVLD